MHIYLREYKYLLKIIQITIWVKVTRMIRSHFIFCARKKSLGCMGTGHAAYVQSGHNNKGAESSTDKW